MKKFIYLLLVTFLLITNQLQAQEYPVNIEAIAFKRTFSSFSEIFKADDLNAMKVDITLRDLQSIDRDARVIFKIQGAGINWESRNEAANKIITLQPSIMQSFTLNDLIDATFYPELTELYPESQYRLHIWVEELYTGKIISRPWQMNFRIKRLEPSRILYPAHQSKWSISKESMLIRWTSVNWEASELNYELSLREWLPDGEDLLTQLDLSPPLLTYHLTQPNFTLFPLSQFLLPGKWYIISVKSTIEGQPGIIDNLGQSTPIIFQYGSSCPSSNNLQLRQISDQSASFSWNQPDQALNAEIEYMYQEQIYQEDAAGTEFTLNNLLPEENYKLRILTFCEEEQAEPSDWLQFRTMAKLSNEDFVCVNTISSQLANSELLETINIGDKIEVHQAFLEVTELTKQQDSKFFGFGLLRFNYLRKTFLPVKFSELQVDKNYRLAGGKVTILGFDNDYATELEAILDKVDQYTATADQYINQVEQVTDSVKTIIDDLKRDNVSDSVISQAPDDLQSDPSGESTVGDGSNGEVPDSEVTVGDSDSNIGTESDSTISENPSLPNQESPNLPDATADNPISAEDMMGFQLGVIKYIFPETPQPFDTIDSQYQYRDISTKLILPISLTSDESELITIHTNTDFILDTLTGQIESISFQSQNSGFQGNLGALNLGLSEMSIKQSSEGYITGYLRFSVSQDLAVNPFDLWIDWSETKWEGFVQLDLNSSLDLKGGFDFNHLKINQLKVFNEGEWQFLESIPLSSNGGFNLLISTSKRQIDTTLLITDFSADYEWSISSGDKWNEMKFLGSLSLNHFEKPISFTVTAPSELSHLLINSIENRFFRSEISQSDVFLEMDLSARLLNFSGTFGVKSDFWDGEIVFKPQNWAKSQDLAVSGNFHHNGLKLQPLESDIRNDTLYISGLQEYFYDGQFVYSRFQDFRIDKYGNVYTGQVEDISANLDWQFGPFRLLFETAPTVSGKDGDYEIYRDTEATLLTQVKKNGIVKEVKLIKAKASWKKTSDGKWKELEITAEPEKWSFFETYGFETFAEKVHIRANFEAEQSYDIVFHLLGKLNEEKDVSNLVPGLPQESGFTASMKKGAEANLIATLTASANDMAWDISLVSLKKLGLKLRKGRSAIAELHNFSYSEEGLLKGRLIAQADEEFYSNGLSMAFDQAEIDIQLYPFREKKDFQITKAEGRIKVYDLPGMTGKLIFEIQVDQQNILLRMIDNYDDLKFNNLIMTDLKLSLQMDHYLDIQKIYGSFAVKQSSWNSSLTVDEFLFEDRQIKKLSLGSSSIDYQGFQFSILNGDYVDNSLSLSAEVLLALDGGEGARLRMDTFHISKEGKIHLGKINGTFSKESVYVDFTAAFEKQRFKGEFKGDFLKRLSLAGTIDIGSTSDFDFGYLALQSSANIPLGTAFKISRLGGNLGFNYELNYDESSNKFTGSPKNKQYIIGLGLGIADMAGAMELYGNPIIGFGQEEVKLNLYGSLSIPQHKPNYYGELFAEYSFTNQTLKGSLNSKIMFPYNTGSIFRSENAVFQFSKDDSGLSLQSSGLEAKLGELVNFEGAVSLKENENGLLVGTLNGQVTADVSYRIERDIFVGDIAGGFELELRAAAHINLIPGNFYTDFSSNVSGIAYLEFSNSFLGTSAVSASFSGKSKYHHSTKGTSLTGDLDFTLTALNKSISFTENLLVTL